MPDAPVPLTIPFTREFTITGWLDLPARDDSHECPVAVGTMADIPVTYLINRGDGRVRALPGDVAAAGARLTGLSYARYVLFSRIGLDMRSVAMQALWRFTPEESDRFRALSIAGARAQHAASPPEAVPTPEQPRPVITLDDIDAHTLQTLMTVLTRDDRNAMPLVSRKVLHATSEQRHWEALRNRACAARTTVDVFAILQSLGLPATSPELQPLEGERVREAALLHTLIKRLAYSLLPGQHSVLSQPLLRAIMALPTPARYEPLLAWLEMNEFYLGKENITPSALSPSLYAALPAQQKARLCIALCYEDHAGSFDTRALGVHGDAWLDIARQLCPADIPPFMHAVMETRRSSNQAVSSNWPAVEQAARAMLNAAMTLDEARRAAVIAGLMGFGDCILSQRARGEEYDGDTASLASNQSLWRALVDAVPARFALQPIHAMVNCFRESGTPWRNIAAMQIATLIDRVSQQEPAALPPAVRDEILLHFAAELTEPQRRACWFDLLQRCEDGETDPRDLPRMVSRLADTAYLLHDPSRWRRLLAFCRSDRLCPIDRARLVARIEPAIRASLPELELAGRIELGLDIADRNGPLIALGAVAPILRPADEERAHRILAGRAPSEIWELLGMLVHGPSSVLPFTTFVFSLLPLPARLEWVGSSHTSAPLLASLMESIQHPHVPASFVSAAFHAVLNVCVNGRVTIIRADRFVPVVKLLRATLRNHPALGNSTKTWGAMHQFINMVQKVGRLENSIPDQAMMDEEREATWDALRSMAPELEAQVCAGLGLPVPATPSAMP